MLKIYRVDLQKREMNALLGGGCCACGCAYSGTYASTDDNGKTNHNNGHTSTATKPGGTFQCYATEQEIADNPGDCKKSLHGKD